MRTVFAIVFFLIACVGSGWADPSSVRVVQWSDIHSGGRWFSPSIFAKSVQDSLDSKPQGLVISGDFSDNSHDRDQFYARFHDDLHMVADAIRDFDVPLFLAVGNDDLAHNYQTLPAEVSQTVKYIREAFGKRCYLDDLGNGVSPHKLGGMKWISLNSVFFSIKNKTPEASSQADQTFAWLREQLPPYDRANPTKAPPVVIITHLPPTWDLVLKAPSWKREYLDRFQQLLNQYPGQVFMVCGHYHRNHIQAIRRDHEPVVVLNCGALATKYGYHANWRELTFSKNQNGRVVSLSYTLHYPEESDWDATYVIVPSRLEDFFRHLLSSEALYQRYIRDVFDHASNWLELATDVKLKERLRDELWLRVPAQDIAPTEATAGKKP